ncbi:MAG: single-stranded DNA-binding protein [Planctomycetes bacterium]|nr:single-stranded DNA-binding protein [Planctomycetota bacterium]
MDLNLIVAIGRLTKDPELRRTPKGRAWTRLRLAVTRVYTDGKGGRKDETVFVDGIAWGRRAEVAAEYLKKGSSVYVRGFLQGIDYEVNGERRQGIRIQIEDLQFLHDARNQEGGHPSHDEPEGEAASPLLPG